jgi:hypothetical protein
MKSATLLSSENRDVTESKPRQSENAKKIARLLKKRRELLEKEKLKLETEEKHLNKEKEVKDLNHRSEPTSEDEDDEPETITENSDSYDSNDEIRLNVINKDPNKGFRFLSFT